MKDNKILKNIISQLIKINYKEVDELIRIVEYKSLVLSEAISIAKDTDTPVNWGIIVKALSNLVKYSIDYKEIESQAELSLPSLNSRDILEEVNKMQDYIESIEIDDNSICYGDIRYAINSTYSDIGESFTELVLNQISLDEFYNIASNLIKENKSINYATLVNEPVASYTICNNASLLIFDIDYYEDAVLVGTNIHDAKWYLLQDSNFLYGDTSFSLDEFLKI